MAPDWSGLDSGARAADPGRNRSGDGRANEQVGLLAMHTLFVREHNHWCSRLAPVESLDGDEIHEFACAIVGAEIQDISYREFVPVLLGPRAIPPYQG